ncbi:7 transmembrane receptor (rhodopsin family) domain-containing protein [Phthorimaea operculella]|nr:7 transmembrane receptor (rhodopsin family) domain-containing protein [Phthorimaea operculella]
MEAEEEFYSICLNLTSDDLPGIQCNYTNDDDNGELLEKVVSRVVPIFFGFIGIVGLVGNALVVLVVAANPGMRSTTNLLIINLAVADLLFVIFCVPFTATDYVMPRWPFGDMWCKVVQYFIVVTAHASVYTLVLMSLDRFMAVVHPIASMSIRTEKNAFLAIACIWVVILTTAIPVGICHGEREYSYFHRNHSSCVFLEEHGYNFLFRQKRSRNQIILLVKALDRYHITYFTVTAQIVSHVLAYMNSCVNPVLYAFLSENFRVAFRKIVSHVLAYMNSCVNPVLYAFLSENFRVAFRKVMYCPPSYSERMSGRPQPTKTTRTGNGNSCHDIV